MTGGVALGGRWQVTPGTLRFEALDVLTAVYHRPSGRTHLLVEPAPQILAALDMALDIDGLLLRLQERFEIDGEAGALAARVGELAEAGLIAPA